MRNAGGFTAASHSGSGGRPAIPQALLAQPTANAMNSSILN
jgi:hypothetical protein